MTTSRRLLVVSRHFPPEPGVAPSRVGKLVKYLERAGWSCTVVTGPPGGHDSDLGADVESARVVRVSPRRGLPGIQGLDWAVAAFMAARREASAADVALVSGGPFAIFALAPFLRIPYVLDLRDPWSWEPRFGRFRAGAIRSAGLALERRGERLAFRRAAAIVTVTPEIAAGYARDFPGLRIVTIRHGFDPDDFAAETPKAREPVVLHAGTLLSRERSPQLLVETARAVRARGIPLRLELIGEFPSVLEPLVAEGRGEGWIDIRGRLARREATAAMQRASVLWVQPGELDFLITGKIYEYLASGTPVVAVAPRTGALASLLGETGGGVVVDEGLDAAAAAVEAALAGRVGQAHEDALAQLALPVIALELGAILEEAAR